MAVRVFVAARGLSLDVGVRLLFFVVPRLLLLQSLGSRNWFQ